MMSIKCRSCNTTFQDSNSLEIHYQYTHAGKEESAVAESSNCRKPSDAAETNNNHQLYKFRDCSDKEEKAMTAISPGIPPNPTGNDSVHLNRNEPPYFPTASYGTSFHGPPYDVAGHHVPPHLAHSYGIPPAPPPPAPPDLSSSYLVAGNGENFTRTPISSHLNSSFQPFQNDHRFHPYYNSGASSQQTFRDDRSHYSSAAFRCDKCDFASHSQEILIHHINLYHQTIGMNEFSVPHRFPSANGGSEPQAEILDLDSHKVHLYQPPNGQPPPPQREDQQPNAMLDHHWVPEVKKEPYYSEMKKEPYYSEMSLPHSNGRPSTGRGSTPLASPDFGNVSTTTAENIENIQSSVSSPPFFDNGGSSSSTIASSSQISSSEGNNVMPPSSSSSAGKNGGKSTDPSYKSNEPRRPKTYNCSACNKWFTSSGHLKRHYNTTLHKNAVKQSGGVDPATQPISAHHHPQKDPLYVPGGRHAKHAAPSSSESTSSTESSIAAAVTGHPKTNDRATFQERNTPFQERTTPSFQGRSTPVQAAHSPNLLHSSPNLIAGPSDIPRGLVPPPRHSYIAATTPSQDLIKCPSPVTTAPLHSSYLPFTGPPPAPHMASFFQQSPNPLYPNFQSPHVSTIHQVTQTSLIGNLTEDSAQLLRTEDALPNFGIQRGGHYSSSSAIKSEFLEDGVQCVGFDQFLSSLNGNVGGYCLQQNQQQVASSEQQHECENNSNSEGRLMVDENTPPEYIVPDLLDNGGFMLAESSGESSPVSFELQDSANMVHSATAAAKEERRRDSNHNDEELFFYHYDYDDENSSATDDVTSSTGGGEPPPSSEAPKSPFLCEKCDKAFNKSCYLTQHNKSFHSGYKPYKCGRCGKRFMDFKLLKVHLEKHAGEKPHKCDICPKQFNHKTDLRRHVCLHTNVRPYACDVCNKGFIRKDHMMKHRETHQNNKKHIHLKRSPLLQPLQRIPPAAAELVQILC